MNRLVPREGRLRTATGIVAQSRGLVSYEWNFENVVLTGLRRCIRIKQPVEMDDEIAHLRVIDGVLRLAPPGRMGARVIRIDADDVELAEVLEFDIAKAREFAAEHQMQQLFRPRFVAHP